MSDDKYRGEGPFDFNACLEEIERINVSLESSNPSLEKSIEAFEKGMSLVRQCQRALNSAELRIKYIMEGTGHVAAPETPQDRYQENT